MRTLGMLGEVAGIAASICKKHNCYPREIYISHLAELKEQMKLGVNIPSAFACNGVGNTEAYHFKDIGWWRINDGIHTDNLHKPTKPKKGEIDKFNYCVNKLGIKHKNKIPTEWE